MKRTFGLALLLASLGATITGSAVNIGQSDTFEDGTAQNWVAGLLGQPHPAPPANQASGGPSGIDDNFLLVTSLGGGGSGSRLSAINFLSQWAGNYLDAGITTVGMDVRNFGLNDIYLRLAFSDPGAGPPSNLAFSTTPILVPAQGDWMSIVFPIAPADLTAGMGGVETALANVTELRIYHSSTPSFPNPVFPIEPIVALLGIDNIQARATSVPDAGSTALLLAMGAAMTAVIRPRMKVGQCPQRP